MKQDNNCRIALSLEGDTSVLQIKYFLATFTTNGNVKIRSAKTVDRKTHAG